MISDPEIASKICSMMLEIGAELDDSVTLVQEGCTESEFQPYRFVAAQLMSTILLDVMNPIYKIHPALKPKELD